MPSSEVEAGKEVAFYSAAVQAWIDTRMERDKTLVTLSAGGIGLSVTILSTVGLAFKDQLWFYVVAFAGFAICVGLSVWAYGQNARYIEGFLNESASNRPSFKQLDPWSLGAFLVGAIALFGVGVSTAYEKGVTDARQETVANGSRGTEPAGSGQAGKEPTGPRQDSASTGGAAKDTSRTRQHP